MNEQTITPLRYLREILATSWKHGGELIAALLCVIAVVLTTLGTRSWLHLQELGGPGYVFLILMPAIITVLLFETGIAAWRLHRRQRIVLANRQTLLDLNTSDRAQLERHLLARFRRREKRIDDRNEARVQRLTNEIAALNAK